MADVGAEADEVLSEADYFALREVLEAADVNKDGKLSMREVVACEAELAEVLKRLGMPGRPRDAFKRLDKDRDGYVTAVELVGALRPGDSSARKQLERVIQKHEAAYAERQAQLQQATGDEGEEPQSGDDDGAGEDVRAAEVLSKELYFQFREVFDYIDADCSGRISCAELVASEAAIVRLRTLFGGVGKQKVDRELFRRTDRNRDGVVVPLELLRELLPHIPPHRLKQIVGPMESEWLAQHPPPASPATKPSTGTTKRAAAPDDTPLIMSATDYEAFKGFFEEMDSDGSGEVSLHELKRFLRECTDPLLTALRSGLTSAADWKALDINRDGYVSFDEMLRRCYPQERQWKVHRDVALHSSTLGLPQGCALAAHGRVVSVQKQRKKPRHVKEEVPLQDEELPPLALTPLPITTPTPARKGLYHDQRIRGLELKVRQLEQQAAAQCARESEKRLQIELEWGGPRLPPTGRKLQLRNAGRLSPEQQSGANSRLFYDALARRAELRQELERSFKKECFPGVGRFLGQHRATQDEMLGFNERLYDTPMAARKERQQAAEDALNAGGPATKQLPEADVQESVARLAQADLRDRAERSARLEAKWQPPRPRVVAAPGVRAAVSSRLYAGAELLRNKRQQLRSKHHDGRPQLKLSPKQQREMVARMSPTSG